MSNTKLNEVKKMIRAILIAEKSNGMPLRILERKFCDTVGKSVPLFGYPDTAALLNTLDDTVYTKPVHGQLFVFPIDTEKTKHVTDLVQNSHAPRRRSRAVTRRIQPMDKTIITNWFGGNNANKINRAEPHSTQKSHDRGRGYLHRQQYNDSHRNGAHISAKTTASSIRSEQKQSNSCAIGATKSNVRKYADMNTDIVKFVGSDDESDDEFGQMQDDHGGNNYKVKIARYLLTFDEENIHLGDLPTFELDKIVEPDRGFRLFLSQVHSPFKFWFQLNDHLDLIDSIMSRLNNFYYDDASCTTKPNTMLTQTPIPDEFLEVGLTCAALFNSEWHRGKIVDILDETVKVFYVDYGTVSETFKTDIRFLDKQFAAQPAFALRGCLDCVRPISGIWTYKAMEDFLERSNDFFTVPILGKATLLNLPEKTVYLDLIDTTGRRDMDIGKWLISANHAYAGRKLLFHYTQRHYNEVYPSFELLENGNYPSFSDIKMMMQRNIDYLAREQTIIIPEMYGYQTIE